MKQKKYMEINNTNDVIKFFNICINNVCKYNFLCLKALNQEKKEIELDLSETTRAWLSSRHKAYATCRLETINNNFSEMKRLKEIIVKPLQENKTLLWKTYLECKPNTTETFEDVFSDLVFNSDDNLNEEYYNFINGNVENISAKHAEMFGYLRDYSVYYDALSKLEMLEQIHSVACDRLTDSGYNTIFAPINTTEDVKAVSANTLITFKELTNLYVKDVKKTLSQIQAEAYKAYKKVRKNPEDKASSDILDETSSYIRLLNDRLDASNYLGRKLDVLLERLEASNTTPLGLDGKIIAAVADFGYGVAGNKVLTDAAKNFRVENVYAHNSELSEILATAIEFPNFAPFLQKLAAETDLHTELSAQSFEFSKKVIESLTEENNPNVEFLNDDNEVKKKLAFITPYGRVWFDGKVLHSFENDKTFSVSSLNNYTVNEETGEFVKAEPVSVPLNMENNNKKENAGVIENQKAMSRK